MLGRGVRWLGLGAVLLVACNGKVSPDGESVAGGARKGDGGGLANGDAGDSASAHGWVTVGEPFGVSAQHPVPTSLVIDPSGAPIVGLGWYTDGLGTTTYRFDGSTWAAFDQLSGSCNSVLFDASGALHASFGVPSVDTLHETFFLKEAQGTTWTTSPTLDLTPLFTGGACNVFAVASGGTAYLAIQTNDETPGVANDQGLSVARFDGAEWQVLGSNGVVPPEGEGPEPVWMQTDSSGAPIVAVKSFPDNQYTFRRWDGTAWNDFGTPLVPAKATDVFVATFALDASDTLYVATTENDSYATSPGPTVQRLTAGVWETIGTPAQLAGPAWPNAGVGPLATDSQGRLTLAFTSDTPDAIAVRRWDPSAASWTNLDGVVLPLPANITRISNIDGVWLNLAIGPDDTPFVGYSVQSNDGRDGALVKRWVP